MLKLATWIRDSDQEAFDRFFAPHPEIEMLNARTTPVAMEESAGLLLSGGPDISAPFHLIPPANPAWIQDPELERDAWEFGAVRAAYSRGLPLLCICKGLQVLNVALGGTLHFDIRGHDFPEMKMNNVQPLRFDSSAGHRFELVNSSHHQALDRLAEPLAVEAWHAQDGIIEQVRVQDYPWGVGVQYHPERDLSYKSLFEDFLTQLKKAPH